MSEKQRRIPKPGQITNDDRPGEKPATRGADVRVVETFAVPGRESRNIDLPADVVDDYADAPASGAVVGMSQVVHDVSLTAGAVGRRTAIDAMLRAVDDDVEVTARPAIGRIQQARAPVDPPTEAVETTRRRRPSSTETSKRNPAKRGGSPPSAQSHVGEIDAPDETPQQAEATRRSAEVSRRRAATARRKAKKGEREALEAEAQRQQATEHAAAKKRESAARRRQEERERAEAAIRAARQLRRIPFQLLPGERIEAAGLNDPRRRRPWLTTERFVISGPGARVESWALDEEDGPVVRRTALPRGCTQVRLDKERFILAPCSLEPEPAEPVAPPATARRQDLPPPVPHLHPSIADIEQGTSFTAKPKQPSGGSAIWVAAALVLLVIVGIVILLAG